jgi:hypothetical protein
MYPAVWHQKKIFSNQVCLYVLAKRQGRSEPDTTDTIFREIAAT